MNPTHKLTYSDGDTMEFHMVSPAACDSDYIIAYDDCDMPVVIIIDNQDGPGGMVYDVRSGEFVECSDGYTWYVENDKWKEFHRSAGFDLEENDYTEFNGAMEVPTFFNGEIEEI